MWKFVIFYFFGESLFWQNEPVHPSKRINTTIKSTKNVKNISSHPIRCVGNFIQRWRYERLTALRAQKPYRLKNVEIWGKSIFRKRFWCQNQLLHRLNLVFTNLLLLRNAQNKWSNPIRPVGNLLRSYRGVENSMSCSITVSPHPRARE